MDILKIKQTNKQKVQRKDMKTFSKKQNKTKKPHHDQA